MTGDATSALVRATRQRKRTLHAILQVLEQQGPLGLGLRGPEPVGEQSLGAVGGDREGREHLAVGDPQLGPDLVVLPVQEQVAHLRWNGSFVDRPLLVLEDLGRSGHGRAGDLLAPQLGGDPLQVPARDAGQEQLPDQPVELVGPPLVTIERLPSSR